MHPQRETESAPFSFAARLAFFYAAVFGLVGVHLPFFPVWLKAIDISPGWIGVLVAVPSLTRFTVLPLVTSLAERRRALRGAMRLCAIATVLGFAVLAHLRDPLVLLVVYALTAGLWTPLVPLTDAYALRAVKRYGLVYGPLRLWGSAAFVAGALACGAMLQWLDGTMVIWVIVAMAATGVLTGAVLSPSPEPREAAAETGGSATLLRDRGFVAIIAASALLQGSHAAYYTFGSIGWQRQGFDGLTIATLWVIGVLAEIVLFALSPRFTWKATWLVAIAGGVAAIRWIVTSFAPPLLVLAPVQALHGISFGLTLVRPWR